MIQMFWSSKFLLVTHSISTAILTLQDKLAKFTLRISRDLFFLIHALNSVKSEHGSKSQRKHFKNATEIRVFTPLSLYSSLIFNKAVKIFAFIENGKSNLKPTDYYQL